MQPFLREFLHILKVICIVMGTSEHFFLRFTIVFIMVAAVVTVLYLTPVPEQYFANCERPCHDLDWPMICRVKITLETYRTLSSCHDNCPPNSTQPCSAPYCHPYPRRYQYLANRLLPSPPIHVCRNDILVVDVVNRLGRGGASVTMHWRGQRQLETPTMDGVPMVTQCPISAYTTFQYKFRAAQAGTHAYHAFGRGEIQAGLLGALVVRQADRGEPLKKYYDRDEYQHVAVVTEWAGAEAESGGRVELLVNGKVGGGMDEAWPKAQFNVTRGLRYRFRLIVSSSHCPVTMAIDSHSLQLIALDGNAVHPMEVQGLTLGNGERADIVVKASNGLPGQRFAMRFKPECSNHRDGSDINEVVAILKYNGGKFESKDGDKKEFWVQKSMEKIREEKTIAEGKKVGKVEDKSAGKINGKTMTTLDCNDGSNHNKICLGDVTMPTKMVAELRKRDVQTKLYLPFNGENETLIHMDGIQFTFPSSPLLTQPDDVTESKSVICNSRKTPDFCKKTEREEKGCECTHVIQIPLKNSVEIVFINQGSREQIFHQHGYHLHVVGTHHFNQPLTMDVDAIKKMDYGNRLFKRNLLNAVAKDTIRVPGNAAMAVRFYADNPGYWLLRDESQTSSDWTRGLDVVIAVGSRGDLPPVPTDFPTCRSWVGPDFFLL